MSERVHRCIAAEVVAYPPSADFHLLYNGFMTFYSDQTVLVFVLNVLFRSYRKYLVRLIVLAIEFSQVFFFF